MTNKIGPPDPSTIGKPGKVNAEATSGSKSATSADLAGSTVGRPADSDDTVALTGRAQLLERLEKSLDSLSPVDDARVAEVRTAIENGDYELNSEAIANAMLRFERLLSD